MRKKEKDRKVSKRGKIMVNNQKERGSAKERQRPRLSFSRSGPSSEAAGSSAARCVL